jgi:methanogenic corrinoid protein MtbC1
MTKGESIRRPSTGAPRGVRRGDGAVEHSGSFAATSALGFSKGARSSEQHQTLCSAVETQVIPRLVEAHRHDPARGTYGPVLHAISSRLIHECAQRLVDPSRGSVVALAEDLVSKGVTLDEIYLELFAPAASYLGDLWSQDDCSFSEVTIGVGRLQQALWRFAPHFRGDVVEGEPWRRAIMATLPCEQHTLGTMMVAQFFQRAGWDTSVLIGVDEEALVQAVRSEPVRLLGLSIGDVRSCPSLVRVIKRLRLHSANPELRIIAGGAAFATDPNLARDIGADGLATDARSALALAQQLVLVR